MPRSFELKSNFFLIKDFFSLKFIREYINSLSLTRNITILNGMSTAQCHRVGITSIYGSDFERWTRKGTTMENLSRKTRAFPTSVERCRLWTAILSIGSESHDRRSSGQSSPTSFHTPTDLLDTAGSGGT